jgi:hypothetical protein
MTSTFQKGGLPKRLMAAVFCPFQANIKKGLLAALTSGPSSNPSMNFKVQNQCHRPILF